MMLRTIVLTLLMACAPFALAQDEDTPKEVHPVRRLDELPVPPLKGPNAIVTDNGSRVQGKFGGIEGGRFVFNDPEVGTVKVKASDVNSILLRDPQRVWIQETRDSEVKEGRIAPLFYREELGDMRLRFHSFGKNGTDEYLLLDPKSLHKVSLSSYSVEPSKWKFTGNISTSFEWNDGNRTRTNYGVNTWFKLQHPKHIFETRESFAYAETDSVRSVQRGTFEASYRYLFTDRNAVFVNEVIAHDDFAKLAIRSITSLGLTFYFLQEEDISLSLDAGVSYSEEHRKRGALNRYSEGGQFSVRLDAKPTEEIRILFNSRVTIPFEAPKESIVTSELSFSFVVWSDLTFGILFRHNHDSDPAPNVEGNDFVVRFLLGWSFR